MFTADRCIATMKGHNMDPVVTVTAGTYTIWVGEYVLRCKCCDQTFIGREDSDSCIYCGCKKLSPIITRTE